ncbi:hypothetical protein ACN47E_004098 [Coniothyrium glycines]
MGVLARLHRAYRSLLVVIDHLDSVQTVKAQCKLSCWHFLELRLTVTLSRPSNKCSPTITIHVRNPLSLLVPMRRSTIALCSVANDIFRCSYKSEPDGIAQLDHGLERLRDFISVSFVSEPRTSTLDAGSKYEHTALNFATKNGINTVEVAEQDGTTQSIIRSQSRLLREGRSTMWKPGLHPTRDDAAIFAILRQRFMDQNVRVTSISTRPAAERTTASGGRQQDVPVPKTPKPCARDNPAFALRSDEETLCLGPGQSDQNTNNSVMHFASPTSDTTLCDATTAYTLPIIHGGGNSGPGAHVGPMTLTPPTRRVVKHDRDNSVHSMLSLTRTPTISLRARAKTNDGMLQFRANATMETPTTARRALRHRRKISLNLPINISQHDDAIHNPSELCIGTTAQDAPTQDTKSIARVTTEERELEYKHRHIFIGTASLDDFLESLEMTPRHTTSKAAVVRTFVSLAATEQLHARLCSEKPNGWEFVSRITSELTSTDYISQLQVKLGSITLRQMLDLIPFDTQGEVDALHVVKAFSAASHIDSKAGIGTRNKARAFRIWLIAQETYT